MIISDLRLWKDCGYTEGSMVKPPINDSLTGYDLRITEDISPSRDRIFSEIRLRTPFDDLYLMTYLQATYEMSDGSTFTFYGWIDNVHPISDSDTPTTSIIWHIDYWRTYASNATYGSGMVTRRPSSSTQPPQPVNYRYMRPSTGYHSFLNGPADREGVWWVLLRFTEEGGTEALPTVVVTTICYPISAEASGTKQFKIQSASGTERGYSLTFDQTVRGRFDEYLGLDPSRVVSAFLSPCAPVEGTWVSSDTFKVGLGVQVFNGAVTDSAYIQYTMPMEPVVSDYGMGVTDDTHMAVIVGFDGETVGSVPWGVIYSSYDYRVLFESVNAYIQLRLHPEDGDWEGSHQSGMTVTIPLPALEVTENSWSSYMYSGAREADITARRIEADKTQVTGLVSTLGSVASGTATGAMMGAIGGPLGMAGGALVGGIGSAVSGTLGTTMTHAYMTGAYDDRMQDMLDTQHAKQSDTMLLQGNGFDAVINGVQGPAIIMMTYDEYSITQWENNIAIYGATVSEPRTSCTSLIRAGGPLRIDNLEVTGDIPNPARAYIRDAFRKGVILK